MDHPNCQIFDFLKPQIRSLTNFQYLKSFNSVLFLKALIRKVFETLTLLRKKVHAEVFLQYVLVYLPYQKAMRDNLVHNGLSVEKLEFFGEEVFSPNFPLTRLFFDRKPHRSKELGYKK